MGKFHEIYEDDYKFLEKYCSDAEMGRYTLDRQTTSHSLLDELFAEVFYNEENIIKKKQKLLSRVFKVASEILTDRQLQIFIMKYVFDLRSVDISHRIHVSEAYVSMILKVCLFKIKKKFN